MKSQRLHLAALLGLAVATAAPAFSQSAVPALVSYQSRVADSAGVPLGNTTPVNRIVLFRIYDSPGASAPANRLYSEQQTVTIANGEFSVLLGSGTPIATESTNAFSSMSAAVFGGATRFLGVTVDDGDGNPFNDPEMSPRQQIVGTPYAFRAQVAETVVPGGVTSLALANGSVGTAALAVGAITSDRLAAGAIGATQIAAGSVGTAQVGDAAITTAKLGTDSVDGSKILDGSITAADFSPALKATLPKETIVYNYGLSNWQQTYSPSIQQSLVFPIDVSDLGVDGDVLISYYGVPRTSTFSSKLPAVFSGQVRVTLPGFSGGNASTSFVAGSYSPGTTTNPTGVAPATNTPFLAVHTGLNGDSNYAVTGFLNSTTRTTTLVASPVPVLPNFPVANLFPRTVTTFSATTTTGVTSYSGFSTAVGPVPLAQLNATYVATSLNTDGPPGYYVQIPMIQIYHFYPGVVAQGQTPWNQDQNNVSTNQFASGDTQRLGLASVQVGSGKLTIKTTYQHIIQVGDSVTLQSVVGTPTVNGSYTVTAVLDRSTFEVAFAGGVGPYTGGQVNHTATFNKYRFWVAVHGSVAARVIVSDK